MSCLDTFCISHFEEKDQYSQMAEVGLQLDKADFAVNGYDVDEHKYPRQGPKEPSTGGRSRTRPEGSMTMDVSDDDSDDANDGNEPLQVGQDIPAINLSSTESSSSEEEDGQSEEQAIPLVGSRLGVTNVDDDENEELARARLEATPRKLFIDSSQPSHSDHRPDRRPSTSTPLSNPRQSKPRRSSRIAQFVERRAHTAPETPETPALIASQASASETPDPSASINQVLLNFMMEMRASQAETRKESNERIEQQRLEHESRLEEQRKEMIWRLEQQRQDMLTISQETVKTVFSQVPQMVQTAVLAVMNVAPLQLKAPTTSQPALMITEGHTTPQGSGTSAQGGSSRVRAETQPHESHDPNPTFERSESPGNSLADYDAITMEVDDVPERTDAPAAG